MSRTLSRVRALVSEIDAIQTGGRNHPPSFQRSRQRHVSLVSDNVIPLNSNMVFRSELGLSEEKILIQLSGKISLKLKLNETDQFVEVRQMGESIEIKLSDGKAIHLPLKNVS